ncbi:MAG: NUMOD3 domain-containing DNA-binding protein, partial [Nanoarchaeota archaeon]
DEHKKKLNFAHKGKRHTEQHKNKIRMSLKGKSLSDITRKKMSISQTGKSRSIEYRFKISESMKKRWQNECFRNRMIPVLLKSLMKRPTSYEQKISDLCFKYNLPFIYKGNGGFLINFKNPDFVNEKDKIAIEVFYSWFKIRDYGSVENYKTFCKKKYESAGWKVIFLDENDVCNKNWEEVCLNKIKQDI